MAFLGQGSEDLGLTHGHLERMFWNTGMEEPTFLNTHVYIRVYGLYILHGLFFTPTRSGWGLFPKDRIVSSCHQQVFTGCLFCGRP